MDYVSPFKVALLYDMFDRGWNGECGSDRMKIASLPQNHVFHGLSVKED